jgi:hypothetical protein
VLIPLKRSVLTARRFPDGHANSQPIDAKHRSYAAPSPENRIIGSSRLNQLPFKLLEIESPKIAHMAAESLTAPNIPVLAHYR